MAIFYDQGEAEGDVSGSDANMTNYTTDVSGIFSDLRADFAGGRNVLGLMTITGRQTTAPSANQNTNYSAVRATQKTMTSSIPNCIIGQHNIGCAMSDTYHFNGPGRIEKHRRNGKSIQFALLGTGYKGSGPQTLTGSRAAAAFFAWDALMLPLGPIARVMTQRSGGVIVRNLSLASQILLIVTVASFFHKAPEFVYRAF